MKKLTLLCAIIMICTTVFALKVQMHTIDVTLNEDGYAIIVEKYYLEFDDILEIDKLNEKAQSNSTSLDAWQADYAFISTHLETPDNKTIKTPVTVDPPTGPIVLNYQLEKPFPTILKDEPREKVFSISGKQLKNFINNGVIVIPQDTRITITLPQNAQIIQQQSPISIQTNNNTFVLSGINANKIEVEYSISKPITTTVNIAESIREFFSNSSNTFSVIIMLLIFSGLLWKKDDLGKRIEDYLVEHSELESGAPEEKIEIDV